MASSDAGPVPKQSQAYRITFELRDSSGGLLTGASGLAARVSKDANTFATATNAPFEIASASGVYALDLTASEMNARTTAVRVTSTSTGSVPYVERLYPAQTTDISVNVVAWNSAVVSTTQAGIPAVDVSFWLGQAPATPTVNGVPKVEATHWGGNPVAATLIPGVPLSDLRYIAGSLVNVNAAQLGVNVVTNADKTGYGLSSAANTLIANAVQDQADGIETGITLRQAIRAIGAICAGLLSGATTNTQIFKGLGNATTRITAVTDTDGNRTTITLNL